MILQLAPWMPGRPLVIVTDRTSAVLDVVRNVRRLPNARAITRLRQEAWVEDPTPAREGGKRGRKAQPRLAQRLSDPCTQWQKHTRPWDGGETGDGDRHGPRAVLSISGLSGHHPPGAHW